MKVTRAVFAKELGVTRQRVHTMIKEGLVVPDSKGKIDLDAALASIAANKDPARGGMQTPVDENFSEARARKERALANLRELEAAEKKGELVNAEDLERELAGLFNTVKTRIRAIGAKCASEIAALKVGAKTQREVIAGVQEVLSKEHDEALTELSRWEPDKTEEKKK